MALSFASRFVLPVICAVGIALALSHRQKSPRALTVLIVSLAFLFVFEVTEAYFLYFRSLIGTRAYIESWPFFHSIATGTAMAGLIFAALDGRGIPLDATAFSKPLAKT